MIILAYIQFTLAFSLIGFLISHYSYLKKLEILKQDFEDRNIVLRKIEQENKQLRKARTLYRLSKHKKV